MDQLLGSLFHDRAEHPRRREVVGRSVLSVANIAVALLSMMAAGTYTHAMLLIGGVLATVAVSLLGVFGALLLLDTVANEIWPARRRLPRLTPLRHWLWLGSGLLHNLFAYLVFTEELSRSLGVFLAIFGWGCLLLTFVDAVHEKAEQQCA